MQKNEKVKMFGELGRAKLTGINRNNNTRENQMVPACITGTGLPQLGGGQEAALPIVCETNWT